jgi:hypothetical protein
MTSSAKALSTDIQLYDTHHNKFSMTTIRILTLNKMTLNVITLSLTQLNITT